MAAVLACGLDSALPHRSASNLRGLWHSGHSLIDVISPRRPGRRRAGIDAHTSVTLLPRDIAEADGGASHTTRRAFEHDRRRDQRLMLAGFRVVRFPWRQVFDEPSSVELTLRELLRQAA